MSGDPSLWKGKENGEKEEMAMVAAQSLARSRFFCRVANWINMGMSDAVSLLLLVKQNPSTCDTPSDCPVLGPCHALKLPPCSRPHIHNVRESKTVKEPKIKFSQERHIHKDLARSKLHTEPNTENEMKRETESKAMTE